MAREGANGGLTRQDLEQLREGLTWLLGFLSMVDRGGRHLDSHEADEQAAITRHLRRVAEELRKARNAVQRHTRHAYLGGHLYDRLLEFHSARDAGQRPDESAARTEAETFHRMAFGYAPDESEVDALFAPREPDDGGAAERCKARLAPWLTSDDEGHKPLSLRRTHAITRMPRQFVEFRTAWDPDLSDDANRRALSYVAGHLAGLPEHVVEQIEELVEEAEIEAELDRAKADSGGDE